MGRRTDSRCAIALSFSAMLVAGCGARSTPVVISPAAPMADDSRPYRLLYSFGGGSGDGATPVAGLVNVKGSLYGTTYNGGADNLGTVFMISRSGKESVLHSFTGLSGDGARPYAGLLALNGTLYGTTAEGGSENDGTVFAISTSGKETPLYSFQGSPDGLFPVADLTNVGDTLYGTTEYGGTSDEGTVFAITTAGSETVVHSFDGYSGDGVWPKAGLVDVGDKFFGTTYDGGAYCNSASHYYSGCGTVFELTRSGNESVIYSFGTTYEDGAQPSAGLTDVDGTLFGTTTAGGSTVCETSDLFGCGTVFKVTTSGSEAVLYRFEGYSAGGVNPKAGVIDVNHKLFGTTSAGGAHGCGTIFAVTMSGAERVRHAFDSATGDGCFPQAAFVDVDGVLYTTTSNGGANRAGTVLSLRP